MSLKVCYVLPRLLPHESGTVVGGCAVNCISVASALRAEGIEVELLTSVSRENEKHLQKQPFSEYTTCVPEMGDGLIRKGLGAIRGLRRGLKDALRRNHFDVVHSHAGTFPYAVVPLVADGNTSVRLHSLYCPLGAKGGVFGQWWEQRAAARILFSRLDRVVAVTDNIRQSMEEAGVPAERIEIVPMCVDTQRFRPTPRGRSTGYFPAAGESARLLFVGNASKEKGLADLLSAVKMLVDKKVPVFLVAAIENQSDIEEYARGYEAIQELVRQWRLTDCVRFVGLVDAIEDLYAEADLLVVPWKTSRGPSDYPMVVLEAMAMGKCVVCTPVGGCSELLAGGDAGLLTRDFSAGSMVSTLEGVINDAQTRSRIEARAVAEAQRFSVRAAAIKMIALYEDLVRRKADSHACSPVK